MWTISVTSWILKLENFLLKFFVILKDRGCKCCTVYYIILRLSLFLLIPWAINIFAFCFRMIIIYLCPRRNVSIVCPDSVTWSNERTNFLSEHCGFRIVIFDIYTRYITSFWWGASLKHSTVISVRMGFESCLLFAQLEGRIELIKKWVNNYSMYLFLVKLFTEVTTALRNTSFLQRAQFLWMYTFYFFYFFMLSINLYLI